MLAFFIHKSSRLQSFSETSTTASCCGAFTFCSTLALNDVPNHVFASIVRSMLGVWLNTLPVAMNFAVESCSVMGFSGSDSTGDFVVLFSSRLGFPSFLSLKYIRRDCAENHASPTLNVSIFFLTCAAKQRNEAIPKILCADTKKTLSPKIRYQEVSGLISSKREIKLNNLDFPIDNVLSSVVCVWTFRTNTGLAQWSVWAVCQRMPFSFLSLSFLSIVFGSCGFANCVWCCCQVETCTLRIRLTSTCALSHVPRSLTHVMARSNRSFRTTGQANNAPVFSQTRHRHQSRRQCRNSGIRPSFSQLSCLLQHP